ARSETGEGPSASKALPRGRCLGAKKIAPMGRDTPEERLSEDEMYGSSANSELPHREDVGDHS
ncbi:hypothetical protein, partial [Novosphingobium sp. TCA1]|uniref:hypothetical protein n=1 Tax=Novosphingobium sp. TCA1 TaxID=2682474 RepID=UPI001F26F13D